MIYNIYSLLAGLSMCHVIDLRYGWVVERLNPKALRSGGMAIIPSRTRVHGQAGDATLRMWEVRWFSTARTTTAISEPHSGRRRYGVL